MDIETALHLYQQMLLARLFEEKAAELYTQRHIYGYCHLYVGQEAVVVGVAHNMQKHDSAITSYRDHAHMLTLGVQPKFVMAELCGKSTGSSHGNGGSMHMYSKEHNFYGGNGIVGAQVPIGVGLAFAHRYRKDNGVAVIFFGDGAANQGQVYEAFNMASLWKLPAIFVLENNHYALGTAEKRAASGENLHTRGDPFGIPTLLADGMNLFDVLDKAQDAISHARSGLGPIIVHADTYRYKGHSMSDPATYRSREEVDAMKARDPIELVKKRLLNDFAVKQTDFLKIEEKTMHVINDAARFAIESPWPKRSELERNVLI
ncbi:MAG: pyruvate dehydrogenase (acetyl-transferring) E1 component subunit alpha [Holosporales bacterium]|nr:pyruvate dehydrogenase (acetyl-transferring) E1 component subunit alpha [Holosporales bacterium]